MHFAACTNTDIDIFFFSLLFLLSLLHIPMLLFLDFSALASSAQRHNSHMKILFSKWHLKEKTKLEVEGGVGGN